MTITFKDFTSQKALPIREKFIRGDIFRLGAMVEDDDGKYQILDRGTNYLTCSDATGNLVKKFITEVSSLPEHAPKDTVNYFKGLITSIADPIASVCFESTITKYNSGQIIDSIAILKALKAYSENDTSTLINSLTRIDELDNHIYLKEAMPDNLKQTQTDKLKVAAVIADTLGVDSHGSSPETMVNLALRNARKNSMMIRGESLKIILRMLELAKSVGIKYDENIIKVPDEVSEEVENLDELSSDLLGRYKKKAGEQATMADKNADFYHTDNEPNLATTWAKKANKKFSGIMQATKKQFANDLKENDNVCVTHESGKRLYGKVKGKHGSVYEISYKNGKVGFHHSHKCALLNELDPITEADTIKTFADIVKQKDVGDAPVNNAEATEKKLKAAIALSAGDTALHADGHTTHVNTSEP